MTIQTQQDNAVKSIVDILAKKYGYPEGRLDSDKGTLSYDVSTPVLGRQEALNRIMFRIDVEYILQAQPDMKITAHFQQLTITLPDWNK